MQDLSEVPDGGSVVRAIGEASLFLSEVKLPLEERYREWKRDPSYLRTGAVQQLYFSGSPSPSSGPERWGSVR